MSPSPPLAELQRWMQAVVVHPGSAEEAVRAPLGRGRSLRVESVIRPSVRLTPTERIGIYHGMYLLRMEEALASDYPALKHFLGDDRFFGLVRDYVQVYPSRSYTLNRLGDHLPEFLRNTPGLEPHGFLVDLARLELATTEVFDAEETPALDEATLAELQTEDWERAILRPVAAFRMLTVRHNVHEYVRSVKEEAHDQPRPSRREGWLVLSRRDYAVYRLGLTQEAYALLAALVGGEPLGAALAKGLDRVGRGRAAEERLFRWFSEWMAAGLFGAVELPE